MPFLFAQAVNAGGESAGLKAVFITLAVEQTQLTKGAVDENVATLIPDSRTGVADDFPAKTVDAFIEIGTTRVKVVTPEGAAAEKAKA